MGNETLDQVLERISGLSRHQRADLMRFGARLPEQALERALQIATRISYKLYHEFPETERKHAKYCALLAGLRTQGWDARRGGRQMVDRRDGLEVLARTREMKLAEAPRKKRPSPVRRRLLAYWGEVQAARAKGYSFQIIAASLGKAHRFKVSARYLARLWLEKEDNDA